MAWVSWRQDAKLRANSRQRALGPQWPMVEQPQPRQGRSAAMIRRTWGQYSSLSPSPAHLSHTRNITLSRINCERLYFYKEVCSFVHWSSYIMFDYVSAYICICICMQLYNINTDNLYTIIWFQELQSNFNNLYTIYFQVSLSNNVKFTVFWVIEKYQINTNTFKTSIWPINRTLTDTLTLAECGLWVMLMNVGWFGFIAYQLL